MQQILTYAFLVIYTVTILGIVLVIITDNTEISIFSGKHTHKFKLHCICILILIHHDIAESFLICSQNVFILFKKLDSFKYQIIKIKCIIRFEHFLIFTVNTGNSFCIIIVACIYLHFVRSDKLVFCP